MNKLLTLLVIALFTPHLPTASAQPTPKLLLCITIDQLRGDYLEYCAPTFGQRGFKRLMNEGIVYGNILFDFPNINAASATATLFTGVNPYLHGISADTRFDFDNNSEHPALYDPNFLGNYTREHFSPARLLARTLGDELKNASQGASDVFAIAPNPQSAILSAGHNANAAFWLNDNNGHWATTTYYKNIPWYIERYNNSANSLPARINQLEWTPALPADRYNAFPYTAAKQPFRHTFRNTERDGFANFKTSPLVNDEVNRLALLFLEYANFNTKNVPSLLAISYYAGQFDQSNSDFSLEIQDAYYRLDKNIEQLLDAIDKHVGLQHSLIVLTGTGYYLSHTPRQPLGTFYPKRCVALLNMYLMQLYGQKNWVKGYYNQQIFLDHQAALDAQLPLADLQQQAANFVADFAGIQSVTTDINLRSQSLNSDALHLRNGAHPARRGDLLIQLQPHWRIDNESSADPAPLAQPAITPLILMSPTLTPNTSRPLDFDLSTPPASIRPSIRPLDITQPLHATQLLQLLAPLLRLPLPNP